MVVNVELNFNALVRMRAVYDPARHPLLARFVEPAAKVLVEGRVIEAYGKDAYYKNVRD
jgi:hypothetical protein